MPEAYASPPVPAAVKGFRTTQPQFPVALNTSNPITRGLKLVFVPGIPVNLATGARASSIGVTTVTRKGRAASNLLTGPWWEFGPYTRPAGNVTFFAVLPRTNPAQSGVIISDSNGGGGSLKFWTSSGNLGFTIYGAADYGTSVALPATGGVAAVSVTSGVAARFFLEGVFKQSVAVGAISAGASNSGFGIGSRYGDPGGDVYPDMDVALGLVWSRALSDEEVQSISENPWQIFSADTKHLLVPVAAEGASSIAPKQPVKPRQSQMLGTAGVGVATTTAVAKSLITKVRTKQPQSPTAIDWSNPVAQGLVGAWNFGTGILPKCAVSGVQTTLFNGTATKQASVQGMGYVSPNATANGGCIQTNRTPGQLGINADKPRTILVLTLVSKRTTAREGLFLVGNTGAAYQSWVLKKYDNADQYIQTNWGGDVTFNLTNKALDSPAAFVAVKATGQSGRVFVDGSLRATASATALAIPSAGYVLIGAETNDGYACGKPITLTLIWNRALSVTEIASVSANPWQVFEPDNRKIWVPT